MQLYKEGDWVVVKSGEEIKGILSVSDGLSWATGMYPYCGSCFKIKEIWLTGGEQRFYLEPTIKYADIRGYTFCNEWVVPRDKEDEQKQDVKVIYLKDILSNYDSLKCMQMDVMGKIQKLQSELSNINLKLEDIRSTSYNIIP